MKPGDDFFLYANGKWVKENPIFLGHGQPLAQQKRFDGRESRNGHDRFRVIGPLSNMPEFYAAFGVKKGDAMWRPDSLRVLIW
jgi:predicted metalloendopeptidase